MKKTAQLLYNLLTSRMVYAFYESQWGHLTNRTLLSQPNSVSRQLSLGFASTILPDITRPYAIMIL